MMRENERQIIGHFLEEVLNLSYGKTKNFIRVHFGIDFGSLVNVHLLTFSLSCSLH